MRALATFLLLALLAVGSGCGGSDEGDAETTVREFVEAISKRDSNKVCDELVSDQFIEQSTLQTGDGAKDACKDQIRSLKRGDFKLVKIDSTKIDGDKAQVRATLEVQKQPQPQLFRLQKQDGRWLLTGGAAG